MIFDVTHLDGQPTTALPYTRRRAVLAGLGINHRALLVPPHQLDVDPAALLELARAHHIEGGV
jgi:bifunctional non-homologous end joining protein LigD